MKNRKENLKILNEDDDCGRLIEISKEQNITSNKISNAMCLFDEGMEIFFKRKQNKSCSANIGTIFFF